MTRVPDSRHVLVLDYSLDVVPCSTVVASSVLVPYPLDVACSGCVACSQWVAACTDTEFDLVVHTGRVKVRMAVDLAGNSPG